MTRFFFAPVIMVILMFSPYISAETVAADTTRTTKKFTYDVYFHQTKIGKLWREENKIDKQYSMKISADLSLLFFKLGGYQQADIVWQPEKSRYAPQRFVRYTHGLENMKVEGNISDDAHQSTVLFEEKTTNYTENKGPITELNSMFAQVRYGLLNGQKQFDFYMQTSDSVSHYFFTVTGKEKLQTRFGELDTFRLEQTRVKNRSLSVWYAPKLDMQMVRFHYKRKVVDISGELRKYHIK